MRGKHSRRHHRGFAEQWLILPARYLTIIPSCTNCLAVLPARGFLVLNCGSLKAKQATLLVITVRRGDPPWFPRVYHRVQPLHGPPKRALSALPAILIKVEKATTLDFQPGSRPARKISIKWLQTRMRGSGRVGERKGQFLGVWPSMSFRPRRSNFQSFQRGNSKSHYRIMAV